MKGYYISIGSLRKKCTEISFFVDIPGVLKNSSTGKLDILAKKKRKMVAETRLNMQTLECGMVRGS